jgi:hypothetical protein
MSDQPGLISCKRVSMVRPKVEPSQVFMFVELVNNKVPRIDALKFSVRTHCQYDSTKRVDGPPKFRIMKSYADPRAVKVNGWMSDRPIVTNDPIQLDLRRIKQQKDWMDKVLSPKFSKLMSHDKTEEENRVKIKRFYQYLDDKCNLKDLSPSSKLAKIKTMNKPSSPNKENHSTKNSLSTTNLVENATALNLADDVKVNLNALKMRFQQHCRSVRNLEKSKMSRLFPFR